VNDKVVRLFGGSYPDLGAQVSTHIEGTVIAAQPGTGRPVIHLNTSSQLEIGYGSSISDVDLVNASTIGEPLLLTEAGATGERLRVTGSAPGPMVKIGAIGSTPAALRDSLVVNDSTITSAAAVAIECNGCHSHAQLAHVTAISRMAPALRAMADSNGNSVVTLDVANSIVMSTGAGVPDIRAEATSGTGSDAAWINVTDSAYSAVATSPREHIVIGGKHLTAAPQFVDAAAGDYTEAPGSPTIDAGAVSPLDAVGGHDALGMPRTLGAATDMGAFEAPAAPDVAGADATEITGTGATLHGTITPNGAPAAWHFEIGTTTGYGTVIGGAATGSAGFEPELAGATVASLQPGTTYHYRLVAEHAYGAGAGEDRTFTTPAAPPVNDGGQPGAGAVFAGVRFAAVTVRLRNGAVSPRLTCPSTARSACTGALRVRSEGRVAKSAFSIAPGRTVAVRVRLGAAVRRALRRSKAPRLSATVSAAAGGATATTKATLRVRVR
jgi:hypothetical protein